MNFDNYVDIGKDKRIKFGLSWDNNDIKLTNLIGYRNRLSYILRPFESNFIDELTSLNPIVVEKKNRKKKKANHYKLRFESKKKESFPSFWHFDNPSFDNEKQMRLTQIVNRFVELGILNEIPNNITPKYLNPIDIIQIDNQWKLWPDFSHLNSFISGHHDGRDWLENFLNLPQSKVFSKLVLKDYAYQIMLVEQDGEYTSFKLSQNGQDHFYKFNTFHPNLKNAAIVCQERLSFILSSMMDTNSILILDYRILLYSFSFDSHLELFFRLMNLLDQSNVKLSSNESELFCKIIECDEFEISQDGTSISRTAKEKIRTSKFATKEDIDWLRKLVLKCEKFWMKNDHRTKRRNVNRLSEKRIGSQPTIDQIESYRNELLNLEPLPLLPKSTPASASASASAPLKRKRNPSQMTD